MPPKRNQNRNKKSQRNSKEAVENAMVDCVLPQDMMLAILARLPAKSLSRFKCVCKPWRSLVTNPNFIKIHSHHFPQTPKAFSVQSHLLKCPILGIEPGMKITADPNNPWEIFIDSWNGLVCMGRPLHTKEVVLWNPATNMWKFLPHSKANFGAAQVISLGFGCDAEGVDFKVVRIFSLKGKKMRSRAEVYSSKSDSWRTIEVGFKFVVPHTRSHVIVNGNPYWIAYIDEKSKAAAECGDCSVLLGFDATNMAFNKIVPKPCCENLGGYTKLPFVNWKGSVAVLVCVKKDGDDGDDLLQWIDVWAYDEIGGIWARNARLGPIELKVDMCLDCSKDGKIVGGCSDGRLFIVDPKTDCVGVSELKKRQGCSFQIFAYDESLAYVKGMTPAVVNNKEHRDKFNDIDGLFVSDMHHRSGEITCYYALAF